MKTRLSIYKVSIGFAIVLFLIGIADVFSASAQMSQEPPNTITINFIEPSTPIMITDLFGIPTGEGEHVGKLRCQYDHCSQKTELSFTSPATITAEYEYKFSTRQAVDIEAKLVVIGGSGTISNNGQKEKFSFTAIFQDNQDGTISVTYAASRQDASFIIPSSPGSIQFQQP